jgi:glyoxylase-like metal-dependent hydrolase (beta-lactamase superfamily II)
MNFYTLVVGPIETNCYIIENRSGEAIIIDPGGEPQLIRDFLNEKKLTPRLIINTHGHFDHIKGNRELKLSSGAALLLHENDALFLAQESSPPADRFLKENDKIELGEISLRVIHTPGHTPGGISLYSEKDKILFSGDTLFQGTYGRTDLPYSSQADMMRSLEKLFALPTETKVYPGHGSPTTIGFEKNLFPYKD